MVNFVFYFIIIGCKDRKISQIIDCLFIIFKQISGMILDRDFDHTIQKLIASTNQILANRCLEDENSDAKNYDIKQSFDGQSNLSVSNVATNHLEESVFNKFSQIEDLSDLQKKIYDFRPNFVTSRRKDELFKRLKKDQEEIITRKKKQLIKNSKNIETIYNNFTKSGEILLNFRKQQIILNITSQDLSKLLPDQDLNDTIIETYLKIIWMELLPKQIAQQTFIYSTYFIERLLQDYIKEQYSFFQRQSPSFTQLLRNKIQENYPRLKKWTKKVDIMTMKYLVIPINAFKHWNCIIIVNPKCLVTNQKGYILYCDSMFEKRTFLIDAVKIYLECQIKQKKGIQVNSNIMKSYQLLLPRQTNSHDCGLYMMTYVQFLLSKNVGFSNYNFENVKQRNLLKIFPRSILFTIRERLKKLLINLINEPSKRQKIISGFKDEKQNMLDEAQDDDYDIINQKQFQKYCQMNFQSTEDYEGIDEQQHRYCYQVKFYLDTEINFYEKDRF